MAPSESKRTSHRFHDDDDEDGYSLDVGPRSSGFHPRNVKDENWTYVDYERENAEYHKRPRTPFNNQVPGVITTAATAYVRELKAADVEEDRKSAKAVRIWLVKGCK